MVEALVGCVAGAVLVEETRRMAENAGLADIRLATKPDYMDALSDISDPSYRKMSSALPEGAKLSDYVVSLEVAARKPAGCCCR